MTPTPVSSQPISAAEVLDLLLTSTMPQASQPSSAVEEPPGLEGMATPVSVLSASLSPKALRSGKTSPVPVPKCGKESPKGPPPGLLAGPKSVPCIGNAYPANASSGPKYIMTKAVSLAQAAQLAQDRRPKEASGEESEDPQVLRLAEGLGMTSMGSKDHDTGRCKPCGFLYKDANGCQNGADCPFCHMCPPGEIRRRKKEKTQWRRMVARQDNTSVLQRLATNCS